MSTAAGATVSLVVLAAAGAAPVLALVGVRWLALPMLPLGGAVLAALAATGSLAIGGTTMTWFTVLAVVGALMAAAWGSRRVLGPGVLPAGSARGRAVGRPAEGRGPSSPQTDRRRPQRVPRWLDVVSAVGAVGIVGSTAWCLRSLATPTIGFDTRSIWLLRSGWFLRPHDQFLEMMRVGVVFLPQTTYPPLVSAVGAVSWAVTGQDSLRTGVVVIALVNSCALVVAAAGLVLMTRRVVPRLLERPRRAQHDMPSGLASASGLVALFGVAAGILLVFVTFGVTEPFMTNGYADPLWSLAMVGAVVYGLQLGGGPRDLAVAGLLAVVAGMAKDEGAATAVVVILLLVARQEVGLVRTGHIRLWWRPALAGLVGLGLIGVWPAVIRLDDVRGGPGGPRQGSYITRAHQAVDGLAPHLHVLLLAVAVAGLAGLVLAWSRRRAGIGNDWWSWAALVGGLVAVIGAYVTGTAPVPSWTLTSAHRVTEFPDLMAWWIIATWGAAGAVALTGRCDHPEDSGRPGGALAAQPLPHAAGGDTRDRQVPAEVLDSSP